MALPEHKKRQNEARLARKAEEAQRVLAKQGIPDDAATVRPGWYDKRSTAAYFDCSVRVVERWMAEGMPHAVIAGRAKFKPLECESWLDQQGRLERRGERRESALLALREQITRAEGLIYDERLELSTERTTEIRELLSNARRMVEAEKGKS